jgi:hypothetical protein
MKPLHLTGVWAKNHALVSLCFNNGTLLALIIH